MQRYYKNRIINRIHRRNPDITAYNQKQKSDRASICTVLAREIDGALSQAESKIWHGSPAWFLDGNPMVGYSVLKDCVRLLFWSGQTFEASGLAPEGSFKAAEVRFTASDQVDILVLKRWLAQSEKIQWDYKHIVKRRGKLIRLK